MELEKRRDDNYILNLGIPGQTSNDILNRIENELLYRINDDDEFNLIFSFGIKDTLLLNNDHNYLNTFNNNFYKLLSIAQKYTKNIYFVGLIIPNIEIRKKYNINNVIKIDECLEKMCNQNKVKYIKIRDLITKDDLEDGLHPNASGHKKISKIILKEIFDIRR